MTRLNWSKVQTETALKAGGARNILDENEWRKTDAAARWLERNDKPKAKAAHRKQGKKGRGK